MLKRDQSKYRPQRKQYYHTVWKKQIKTAHGRAHTLYNKAQQRAKKNNLPIDITPEWIEEKIQSGFCEKTGIPFELDNTRGPFSPSVDQREPGKGYTKENVQVVVLIYNMAKANFKHEDVVKLANFVKGH